MFERKNLNLLYVEKTNGNYDLSMGFLLENITILLQRKAKKHSYSPYSYNCCCQAAKEAFRELVAEEICEDVDKVIFDVRSKFIDILKANKAIFNLGQDL